MSYDLCRVFVSFSAAALCLSFCVAGAEGKSEAEVATSEDAAAAKLDPEIRSPLTGMVFEGVFTPSEENADQPDVLGTFTTAETAYLVKAASTELKKKLTALRNRRVSVFAKLRNEGKYIVIIQINPILDPPPNLRKSKGF